MISPKLQALINRLSDLNPAELGELKAALNGQLEHHLRDIGARGALSDDEWLSLDNNNRLSCIKSVRNRTGLGLLDASAYVDRARAKKATNARVLTAAPLLEDSGDGLQRGSEGAHALLSARMLRRNVARHRDQTR
jgi:ribosomal protein L7/L12